METAGSTRERDAAEVSSCVSGLRAVLAGLVDGLVPELVPFAEATTLWNQFAEVERLAASARLLLARRVSDSRQWSHAGFSNPAEWMAAQTGSSVGRARADLGTSERLALLPDVESAVRSGGLSPEQADIISDAATVNPAATDELIHAATSDSHKNLKDRCGRRKAEADPDPDATRDRIHRERRARSWADSEGAWNLSARGTAESAAPLIAAWERLTDRMFRDAHRAGRREPREAYAYDALLQLAATATPTTPNPPAGAGLEATGPEATAPGGKPVVRGVDPTHLALIRVDLAALARGRLETGELCEIKGVGSIPVSAARRLLGDSVLKLVITRGQDVANVTHLGRGPNTAQKVALLWSHPGCTVAGCSTTRTQDDHRVPFATKPETRLDNIDPLCPHHHRLKTNDGWALTPGRGSRPFVPPGDPRHPRHGQASRHPDRPPPGPSG